MNCNDFSCPEYKQILEYYGELFKCSYGSTFNLINDIPDFLVDSYNPGKWIFILTLYQTTMNQ